MRPRIYPANACKEQEEDQAPVFNIYLGNLKKGFKKGKERFTGNVLIEPFLTIPEKFISTSSRTGKKIIRIVIDENKDGTDMYGFTHNIRVDSFITGKEMDSDLENENIFEKNELRCSKLGISESKIADQNDMNVLKNWKIAIDKEIGQISTSIDVRINGCKLDNDTYLKMKKNKRIFGVLSQQIQTRLSEVRKENHKQGEIRFVVERRKYHPAGSTPYTEESCLFLSHSIQKSIDFIKDDKNDDYSKNYHWYWVIIKMKLNDDISGEIVKVFDKDGNETTEKIMLTLD